MDIGAEGVQKMLEQYVADVFYGASQRYRSVPTHPVYSLVLGTSYLVLA